MVKCDICDKEFENYRKLNGHKRMHGVFNGKLIKKRKPKIHNTVCINCNISFYYSKHNSKGKFCSAKCCGEHKKKKTNKLIEQCLVSQRITLKRYLFEKHGEQCSVCGLPNKWKCKTLPLELDHIDGISDNNNINNLRIICQNCHSQTSTSRARNRKNNKRNTYLQKYKQKNGSRN